MPAIKKGKEVRAVKSVRIEPSIFKKILNVYGSLSGFLDLKIKDDKKLQEKHK